MKQFEHGGNVWLGNPSEWLDFSSNMNLLGCPKFIYEAIDQATQEISYYPQVNMENAKNGMANYLAVDALNVLPTNGGISAIDLCIARTKPKRVLVVGPSFVEYERISKINNITFKHIGFLKNRREIVFPIEMLKHEIQAEDLVIVCNPSNPVGCCFEVNQLEQLLAFADEKKAYALIDEAFSDFNPRCSLKDKINEYTNLMIVGSLTKFFCIPGIRLGYVVCNEQRLKLLAEFQNPWSISAFANRIACHLDKANAFIKESLTINKNEREWFKSELEQLGFYVFSSKANYLLLDGKDIGITSHELANRLKIEKILIRECNNYHDLDEYYFRVSVKKRNENEQFTKNIEILLGER